jgi:hypothetical protein
MTHSLDQAGTGRISDPRTYSPSVVNWFLELENDAEGYGTMDSRVIMIVRSRQVINLSSKFNFGKINDNKNQFNNNVIDLNIYCVHQFAPSMVNDPPSTYQALNALKLRAVDPRRHHTSPDKENI